MYRGARWARGHKESDTTEQPAHTQCNLCMCVFLFVWITNSYFSLFCLGFFPPIFWFFESLVSLNINLSVLNMTVVFSPSVSFSITDSIEQKHLSWCIHQLLVVCALWIFHNKPSSTVRLQKCILKFSSTSFICSLLTVRCLIYLELFLKYRNGFIFLFLCTNFPSTNCWKWLHWVPLCT